MASPAQVNRTMTLALAKSKNNAQRALSWCYGRSAAMFRLCSGNARGKNLGLLVFPD